MKFLGDQFGKSPAAKAFAVAMILVGIFAVARYGSALAYTAGKVVGAN